MDTPITLHKTFHVVTRSDEETIALHHLIHRLGIPCTDGVAVMCVTKPTILCWNSDEYEMRVSYVYGTSMRHGVKVNALEFIRQLIEISPAVTKLVNLGSSISGVLTPTHIKITKPESQNVSWETVKTIHSIIES